jgi:hypothetical protein
MAKRSGFRSYKRPYKEESRPIILLFESFFTSIAKELRIKENAANY